ncbi:MAG: hypothetical protein RL328_1807 [Acidobacteriota bacterium]
MCPHCRAFITTDDRVCPYCDTEVGMRAVDRRMATDAMAGVIQGDQFITFVLVLINVGIYIATAMDDRGLMYLAGQKNGVLIFRNLEWWRLITAGYLHGGLLHIGMNMYALFNLGPQIDAVFGTNRYITIYTVSTLTGFLLSAYWAPFVPSVGASAAICGLVGAIIGVGMREKNTVLARESKRFIPVAVMVLAQGFLLPLPIDNAAHIGGFLGGMATAYVAGTRGHARGEDGLWKTLALVCVGVTIYAFFKMAALLMAVRA